MKIVANKFPPQKLQKDNQQDGFLPIVLKENVLKKFHFLIFQNFGRNFSNFPAIKRSECLKLVP